MKINLKSHNPYFNRWFSAIQDEEYNEFFAECHNPYFNRWFSAMQYCVIMSFCFKRVTILILIDGFLQSGGALFDIGPTIGHNPYFNRWFSAIQVINMFENLNNGSQSLF